MKNYIPKMDKYLLSKSQVDLENVNLPKIGYYGKPLDWDNENAEVICTSWKIHKRS